MKTNPFIHTLAAIIVLGATTLPILAQSRISPSHSSVDTRLREQYRRIDQGVASGQLTHMEATHLRQHDVIITFDNNLAHITGGKFTRVERARLESKLNKASRTIHRDRHNDRTR